MRSVLLALLLAACSAAPSAPDPTPTATLATSGSAGFIDGLRTQGRAAVPRLEQAARQHASVTVRGEAILALAAVSGPEADAALKRVYDTSAGTPLVQTWAAAARVQRAQSVDEIVQLAPLATAHPALKRPFRLQLEALPAGSVSAAGALTLMESDPSLHALLTPMLAEQPPSELVDAMLQHPSTNARRTAAGLLASMASQDRDARRQIVDGLAYERGAEKVPWDGGALYIPSAQWSGPDAEALVGQLISWHLFCQQSGATDAQQQINNNLRSVNLIRPAGLQSAPYDTDSLLRLWGDAHGPRALLGILQDHDLTRDPHYAAILADVEARR